MQDTVKTQEDAWTWDMEWLCPYGVCERPRILWSDHRLAEASSQDDIGECAVSHIRKQVQGTRFTPVIPAFNGLGKRTELGPQRLLPPSKQTKDKKMGLGGGEAY